VTYGVSPITLFATSTSGLTMSFSVVSGPGTVNGSTLTITGAGTVVVAANQAGNTDYAAAAQVTQSVTVNKAVLTVTADNASRAYGAANPSFTDTLTGFVNGDTSSVASGAASLTTTATSTSAPGSYPITAAAGTLAAANYSFVFVNGTLTVMSAAQTITFTPLSSPVTYGVSPITLFATSTSGLTMSFSVVSGPGTVNGSTLTITGAGTVVVAANQAGNADYAAAAQVTQSVIVNAATPAITWATPAPITYGTALSGTQLNASLSVAGPCVYTPAAGTILSAGTQVLSVNCTPTDTADYATPAEVTVQLTVNQATPVITWTAPAAISAGTALSAAQLDATSTVAGAFSYTPASGTVLAAGTQTLSVILTPTDTVDYTTATASVVLTVNPAVSCAGNGYSFGRAITINHNLVPNTDQTSFPFLLNTTDPLLATTANGGHVSNSNGYDIFFTSDAAGQNPLPYEMEEYNPQTGQVIAWVQIPIVSHSQDTTIYLFYGNPNITTSQQNPTSVWDANYLGVWHVANNGGQLTLADSTSNQNNATNNGATVTAGQIDSGMATNGTTYATVGTRPDMENTLSGTATYSVWVKPSANTYGGIFGQDWPGWALAVEGDGVEVELSAQGVGMWVPINSGEWSYLTVTITQIRQADGTQVSYGSAYVNGVLAQGYPGNPVIDVQETISENPTATTYLGLGPAVYGNQSATASEDEFRISSIARSPDWIATEYANQSSPSIFYDLSPEGIALNTYSGSLYQGQTQQFTASVPGNCSGVVSWSISPIGAGTIDQTGLYTAPASIATQQTVTVTATSGSTTVTATITLIPPVAVSVTPATVTLTNNGGQKQQFTASVTYTSNTAVTWSISPAGTGTIDANGLYTAPSTILVQQTVTVTATSQADTTKSASASITLTPPILPPPVCASNGYSFSRTIVIDHTQVPNTDQANFPFLINTTDPSLATTGNGGHMANINAFDLIFTTDPAGQNQLNYEIEEYSPVTGQIIAWIQIPNLSHTTDTVLYMFYGNASIAASQQNPTAVWDSNYMGVWHVANNGGQLSLADSTSNGNNGTNYGALSTAGQIDGGMETWGGLHATIGTQPDLANLAHGNATFSAWINNMGTGGIIMGKGGYVDRAGWTLGLSDFNYGEWTFQNQAELVVYDGGGSNLPLSAPIGIGNGWSYISATISQSTSNPAQSQITMYVNGIPSGTENIEIFSPRDDSALPLDLAYNDSVGEDLFYGSIYGDEDEFRVSNIARSADWIATEYNNQSSHANFYQLYPENAQGTIPTSTMLYASQWEQFTAVKGCGTAAVTWSMPAGYPGTLTTGGLYTAPASISVKQSISVSAANQADGSKAGAATILLMPPVSISLTPTSVTLQPSKTQQFTAIVANANQAGVTWSISPPVGYSYWDVGSISSTGLYTPPVPSSIYTEPLTFTVTATSQADPNVSASATVLTGPTVIPNAPTLAIEPATVTLFGGQSEQYIATVANSDNTAVTWSMSPTGYGTLSATGLYTAPPVVTSRQTITITAVSQTTPSLTATAVLTLSPTQCAAKAYSYERPITIDHTKVPNSDQENFPFYFAVTDPTLASTVNGGHMANAAGYDIEFSSDPAGLNALDYELEQYNPVTGQIVAWVRVPNLSHSSDTVIYMFYGNASIAASQQNPSGVWNSNYVAVYQFDGLQSGSVADLTSNGNNAWNDGAQPANGEPGGAASFDGASSYINLPTNDFPSYPVSGANGSVFNSSFGVWFKTASSGVILSQMGSNWPIPALYIDTNGYLRANFFELQNAQQIMSSTPFNDNNWHYAALIFSTDETTNTVGDYGSVSSTTSGRETVYLDGQVIGSQDGLIPNAFGSTYYYYLGTGTAPYYPGTPSNFGGFYFNGSLDQVEISSVARSGDWVRAEYLNQSSPTKFFTLSPEASSGGSLTPLAVTLYAQQSQQFTVLQGNSCEAANAVYSIAAGSPGTISPTGLYTSPTTIDTQQTVTVTATTLGANSTQLSAIITLMPPVGVSVSPGLVSMPAGGTQQFTANVTNTTNTGVTWSLDPASAGTLSAAGLYTAPATVSALQTVNIIATSLAAPTQSASATVTLGVATPPVPAISIAPQSTILYAGNTQQFTAMVTNAGNIDVTWSISPVGMGTIDGTGLFTAPAAISAQQSIVITATSQANPAVSASATVALMPAQCISNGYSYVRAITIDHTKIPNTDQANFPFLYSITDPLLATIANGGHVTSTNGYDIVFTSDSAGQNPLNYEVESYNPATGQVIAWVQIPALSHSSDTTLYLFYGNSNVTASQQNATGVWDSNYGGVWHLSGNGAVVSTADSTANANNATLEGTDAVGPGEFGNGAVLNGSGYFDAGNQPSVLPTHTGTMSAWVNSIPFSNYVIPIGNGDTSGFPEYGAMITIGSNGANGSVAFRVDGPSWIDGNGVSGNTLMVDQWYYLTASWDGSNVNLYVNGALVSTTGQSVDAAPCCDLKLGWGLTGSIEEARVSGIARSADWIAAEYNNQSSSSTFFTQSAENLTGIAPNSVALYANQSQQFTAPGLCSAGVNWSLSSNAAGMLTSSGIYTAPSAITAQQTVTVTATSQTNSGQSASATVTLLPAISVTISPVSITLNENQTQQFTATVSNSLSQAVNWTITPAGSGSLDQTGTYIAPSSIRTQQTVTVTATSQTDPSKSASAMIALVPSVCASTGYGYQRVIVIDHSKVANTDQVNYPFLFNSTNPDLASVDNGGHVINLNGSDIIFSSDPKGQTRLDFEVEQYNPATGQLVAWIRIPMLSHAADTVIYVFYGNPAITASQANFSGVWDSNYEAVYHLGNLPSTEVASDSTSYANNASFTNLAPVSGLIDGSASLDGVTSYLEIPAAAFPNYPTGVYNNIGIDTTWNNTGFDATFGIWFKTASWGGLLDQTSGYTCGGWICITPSPEQPGQVPGSSWGSILDINFDGNLDGRGIGASTQTYNDNNWHYATITFENGVNKLYADGQLVATGGQGTYGFSPNYAYFVGTEDVETDTSSLDSQPWKYLNGQIDEISVSSIARSGDWIQTQYNNQSSPSTFYTFYSPTAIQVAPSSISLYALQSEQFTVPGTCDTAISWSLPSGSLGTLTSSGLYTAPPAISSQQTVTVSAANQSSGSSLGSALVTLLPAPQPLTLIASSPSPYQVGSSQTFTATLLDPQGNPRIGVTVNFTVAGVNATVGSAATATNGTASFSYTGSNIGTDTVQAIASVDGALLTSSSLTAAWLTPSPVSVPTVTLLPQPTIGLGALVGAFTDSSGDVVEPIAIGSAAKTFVVPAGATQLQLGIDDNYYEENGGSGFVVDVNGVNATVPPTAQPWNWQTGGLNNNYQFGINDGSNPVIGAANLTPGQPVSIAYQSGTVIIGTPLHPTVDANGEADVTTGTQVWQGAFFPTLYTTGTAYPQSQPVNVFAVVTDATGAPIPNTPVTLSVAGANPGQYQAVSDATGTASFLYTGQYAGNDSLRAQAVLNGGGTFTSNQTAIDWTNYPTPPPIGSLSLNSIVTVVNSQSFSSFAKDASGNPLENVNVGFYVTGVDNFQSSSPTNNTGQASFSYYHTQSGNYSIIAVDSVGRNVIVTPVFTGNWVVPVGGQSSSGSGDAITVGISAATTVTMPNTLQLNGTATDSQSNPLTVAWSQVSGPGTVTFANSGSLVTTASFSDIGSYVLQLTASDTLGTSASVQTTVTVTPPLQDPQGWIGSPLNGSAVTGIVPITLAPNIAIQPGGILTYYPANNSGKVTTLPITAESGTIGTLDTTMLPNGSYWIQLQATEANGEQQYSLILVNVVGNYKPGRLTTTVTDLVVPATGLPINIQRSYDSLNATISSDFGYGWNLGINVNLTVDNLGNVSFTLGGLRRTFYLAPTMPACSPLIGCLFPWYYTAYTPEPGLHGTLSDSGSGCDAGLVLELLHPDGSLWMCPDGTQFSPTVYVYTDPNGTAYTISAAGNLQSIVDRSGNGLTITASGITSTTGLNVPFVRDAQNRITQITDPQGNIYSYGYDANGNLATVQYPNLTQPSTYNYDANHHYTSGTDARGNPLPITTYYGSIDTDPNGLPLNGRVKSGTDALGQTRSYTYDLVKNSMTVTFPPDGSGNVGSETSVDDSYGMMLSYTNPLGNTNVYAYDANHNRISETDPLGHTTTYTYDSNGNTTSTTYPATATSKNTTSYTTYNQYSEATSFTDELGNVRTYNYDANYNPLSVTDSLGVVASYTFNASGQPLAGAAGYDITARPGLASQYAYDGSGNLVSSTDALGRTTTSAYNILGQKISSTVPIPGSLTGGPASTTDYQYDPFGNLLQTTAPLGDVTNSQYDANNNRISSTDARGNVTTYQYDALNRLATTTYPDGTTATKTYDFRNNVINSTDQNGNVTHNTYYLDGKLFSVTRGYGTSNASTTSYTYDADGRKQSDTDPLGHITTYFYDNAGHLITVTNAAGSTRYAYDDAGNQISVTDPNGNTTQSQFDARKRLVKTIFPDSTFTTTTYDGPGNVISTTDQAGNVVQNTYDAANELVSVAYLNSPNAPNNTTAFAYNSDGNQTAMTDENGHTTQNVFDVLSRLTSTTLPDGSLTASRQYDAAGNLVSLTHFNGKTTTFAYDNLNRLILKTPDPSLNEPTVSYTYTPTGRRSKMTVGSRMTDYSYNSLDQLTAKATPEGTLSYTYDAAGNVTSVTSSNANGVWVSYTYDDLGRLSTVVDNRLQGNQTTTYTYDPVSNLATATYPNGLQATFTYDPLNRLTALSTPVSSYSYQLGPVGNRTNVTEGSGRTVNWNYDGVYRLTKESISSDPANVNGGVSYSLDPVGNRKSSTSTLSGVNPESSTFTVDDELTTDVYDNNGNTTHSGVNSFTYDSENELKTMNGGAVTLIYDGDGNRVAKSVNGVTTRYLIDDLNPTGLPQVVEETVNNVVQRQYTYGLQLISENQIANNTWITSFYQTDGTGSVRQLTNSAGVVTDTYEYDAFGNKISSTGTTPNNYLYRGEQYDPDLVSYYLRARYYNPLTGRFLSVDPETSEGQRRYEYAGADPVNGMDPSGNEAIIEFALINNYPGRLSFISVHFPTWCDLPGIGSLLPWCGGPGGPPKPPKPPCKPCFNTALFASTLDSLTAGNTAKTKGRPGKENSQSTYCGWYVGTALNKGGANVPIGDGYSYANSLPSANFEIIDSIPHSVWGQQHSGQQGDITVFGRTLGPKGHASGHVEGYTGSNPSGWTSYWPQEHWYPYGRNATPAGPATIFRSKCPCGQ
jgi:RHS repeat-associated protein